MTMVETILNAITYVLVAFTAISLVVSSVMIGIITYVSVVERTKEIGVLRSLGARKKDIKNLFNGMQPINKLIRMRFTFKLRKFNLHPKVLKGLIRLMMKPMILPLIRNSLQAEFLITISRCGRVNRI